MKSSKIFNLKGGYLMRQKNIKKNNKFNNSCNQNECNNKAFTCDSKYLVLNSIVAYQNVISSKKWLTKNVNKQSVL